MTDQTRHVTLMVTHPGGTGHRTLDHHIPVKAADELEDLVIHLSQSVDGPGGRYVSLFSSVAPWAPAREVDDATADRVIAAMLAHMPQRTYKQLLADAASQLRNCCDCARADGLATEIDAALTHPDTP